MSNQGIRIQPDWDKAIIEKDRSFWFHLYDSNKTHYQKVDINEDNLIPNTPNVGCSVSTSKTICLRDNVKRLQSTFQSPDFRFASIHRQSRQPTLHLNSFDVNASGGLAVSAASDGNVFLWETRSSDIRRIFDGHASEVYVSRFFPSGLVVLTGSGDMQLRVWCAITGNCAAVLRAGLGGADKSANNETEPGGHRSGVVDVDFIDRGRNVIALDRGGWFRLWDISTQIAISAISVAPRPPGGTIYSNCLIDDAPICCAVKKRVSVDYKPSEPAEKCSCLETTSTRATTAGVADKLVAIGCGNGGRALLFDISNFETRKSGAVAQLTLPSASGAITSCATAMEGQNGASDNESSLFNEFGLFVGGSNGEIACWDLRNCSKPLLSFEAYKYGICSLKLVNIPAQTMEALNGDSISVPAFTGLFSAYRDGRVILRRLENGAMNNNSEKFSKCLELTGPETEAICGLSIVGAQQSSIWTGTYSAQFFGYRRIAVESLFDL